MSTIKLSWHQARLVKEQIEAAEAGAKLGRAGQVVTPSEALTKWDDRGIEIELLLVTDENYNLAALDASD